VDLFEDLVWGFAVCYGVCFLDVQSEMLLTCCCTSLCDSQSFLTLSMDPQGSLDLQT
jgi:hypothetical protein